MEKQLGKQGKQYPMANKPDTTRLSIVSDDCQFVCDLIDFIVGYQRHRTDDNPDTVIKLNTNQELLEKHYDRLDHWIENSRSKNAQRCRKAMGLPEPAETP